MRTATVNSFKTLNNGFLTILFYTIIHCYINFEYNELNDITFVNE